MIRQKKFRRGIFRLQAFLLSVCFAWAGCLVDDFPAFAEEDIPMELPLMPPTDTTDEGDTISMSFDGALLKDVLLLFSQQSGMNFVASQEVETKKITVYFENVSTHDALDAIVSANGLAYSKKEGSDIFLVFPANKTQTVELVTKVIRLKYMRLSGSPIDVGGAVTIGDLTKSSAPEDSSTSSSSSSASSSTTPAERGADKLVQKLLTSNGKLATDIHTNSLILTDTKENVEKIEKILQQVDVPPMQVVLEVHIMEVSKIIGSDVGIDWGGTDGALGTFSSGIRTTSFPFKEKFADRLFGENKTLRAVTGAASDDVLTAGADPITEPQMTLGLIDANNFTATLRYIESDSKTKVLARPRILTQNNEAAAIQLVRNAAIGTTTATTSTSSTSTQTTEQAERAQVGVTMRMTPQINNDDTVSLFLEPSVTTTQNSGVTVGSSQETQDTVTRLVRTIARVKNNQVLVIGGLMDGQSTETTRKMPFLGDLPLLGKAFRYDAVDDSDRELLVFVVPHIVKGSSSLGPRSATAVGEDTAVRRMLDQFIDREMDQLSGGFSAVEKKRQDFYSRDEDLVRASERRYSNPLVEKQMTQALDSLSPQVVDYQVGQALDKISSNQK